MSTPVPLATRMKASARRELLTPEGVAIGFERAPLPSRALAFLIDYGLVFIAVLVVIVVVSATFSSIGGETATSIGLVMVFLLRNFYFLALEMRWAGRTIGKRLMKLRVISRDGRPLSGEAIIARNLTRNLETEFPLFETMRILLVTEQPGWTLLMSVAWLMVVPLLPLFNRDRLRAGDLVGGTMVVCEPRPRLRQDLADKAVIRHDRPMELEAAYQFTDRQLDLYGIYELQVLEQVLRDADNPPDVAAHNQLMNRIVDKILLKIEWPADQPVTDDEAFLNAFYRAQRGRLERQMLLGNRRERKVDNVAR